MASNSPRTPPNEYQNIEETNKEESMKRSCEHATSSPDSKVQQEVNNSDDVEEVDEENMCSSGFTTPKGKRFRIPKVSYEDCPPAPMRSRPVRSLDHSPSNTKKVFASPEIDSFFIHSQRF
ncbi:hypothetical protein P8452_66470 [Trifolium repens]|nr:hypothetical protein P8452_66470 [Trifolium repens]